ncbi:MAG TPA: glycosyltransferase, partial [Pirellulales bacterium]|nr:glycosyltransferase [Pirellulales bacterium]
MDPYLPVPPLLYGGIERIVDFLVRGLVSRGHRVTLLANPQSDTAGRLIPYGLPPHAGLYRRAGELLQAGRVLWRHRRQVDLVHSFGRLAAMLPILPLRSVLKVQSYQRAIPWSGVAKAASLAGNSIRFTACAAHMFAGEEHGPRRRGQWSAIFNGVDLKKFRFQPGVEPDAPLAFLGRLEAIKGAHAAIAIARQAGKKLVIAGNRVEAPEHQRYFNERI